MLQTSKQEPIDSPFNRTTTAERVMKGVDLKGKNVIVTGGYSGIGLKVTEMLTQAGAHVIVPARTVSKALPVVEHLKNAELGLLDLMDPDSIDRFAKGFLASNRQLDLLVECAGIMFPPLKRDSRGNESQFSTNFLGHFQLTAKLYPALKKAGHSRVILMSSRAQSWNGVDFGDPNFKRRKYDPRTAYAQSKAADALFAVELNKRGQKNGVHAFAVHPGLVPGTELSRYVNHEPLKRASSFALNQLELTHIINAGHSIKARFHRQSEYDYFKTVSQGAASTLWAATSDQLTERGGVFIEDCNISHAVSADSQSKVGVRPWSIDTDDAAKLWHLGEKLTETVFPI
ncbi:SDR family NAD(P)-dependent oxidoreductase [Lentilactobacillus hilgardii]|uniref:SDR family NAD(P)-dependent oxidoreductase n=1 Tax=Lentilactobacillus hilgardii TaxID=1588 RepID=UPI0021E9226C|nr:SDR family NAD(P)-dependent oxidoreductase [Lentilactobacillus hilgardii]MCV3740028.1 SDR family NAD(P)-dependent oxidoreductase [Lentilactobacillus hilgardii]